MASATKIFGERFEDFYSDCVVKRCACQTTARARTGAQYEARTYGENQALKTRDQSSSLPTYRLECLTCGIATVRRYKADAESRLSLNLHQKKRVANGLLSMNVEAFNTSNEFTSRTSVWNSSSEASVSPGELCNPAFEEDDQTDICPIDQAIPVRDSNDNISSQSTNSMYKSSKGSVHSDQAYVRFSDSKTKEKDSEPKTVANLGSALDRKRSLSEIFLRTTSAKDSLKRKLRSSFS